MRVSCGLLLATSLLVVAAGCGKQEKAGTDRPESDSSSGTPSKTGGNSSGPAPSTKQPAPVGKSSAPAPIKVTADELGKAYAAEPEKESEHLDKSLEVTGTVDNDFENMLFLVTKSRIKDSSVLIHVMYKPGTKVSVQKGQTVTFVGVGGRNAVFGPSLRDGVIVNGTREK